MLLYSLLHLTGVKSVSSDYEVGGSPAVTLDDIKKFRQLDSKCPGHPEYHLTSGVETTTGPLGQGGLDECFGMAFAERWLAEHFNRAGFEMFGYNACTRSAATATSWKASAAKPPRSRVTSKLANLC